MTTTSTAGCYASAVYDPRSRAAANPTAPDWARPLGHRAHLRLAAQLPPPTHPLRTIRRPAQRIPHARRRHHLPTPAALVPGSPPRVLGRPLRRSAAWHGREPTRRGFSVARRSSPFFPRLKAHRLFRRLTEIFSLQVPLCVHRAPTGSHRRGSRRKVRSSDRSLLYVGPDSTVEVGMKRPVSSVFVAWSCSSGYMHAVVPAALTPTFAVDGESTTL